MALRKLLKGSFVLLVGLNVANIGTYLFNVFVARRLGPVPYGEFVAMVSILTLFNVPTNVLLTTVTRFIAVDVAKKNLAAAKGLLRWYERKLYLPAVGLAILFALLAIPIAHFLNIRSPWTVVALAGGVFGALGGLPVVRGGLQGIQRFGSLAITFLSDAASRLTFGIGLVVAGLGSAGAVLGLTIGTLASFSYGRIALFRGLPQKAAAKTHEGKAMLGFALPTFFALLGVTMLTYVDVLFAKHNLSAHDAGQYGALSTIGHIALYLPAPIFSAVVPLAATTEHEGKNPLPLFLGGLGLTALAGGVIAATFGLWPNLVTSVLYGKQFLSAAPYLGMYALAMLFGALATMEAMYLLAINRHRFVWFIVAVAVVQVILLGRYGTALSAFLPILVGTTAAAAAGLFVFALMGQRKT